MPGLSTRLKKVKKVKKVEAVPAVPPRKKNARALRCEVTQLKAGYYKNDDGTVRKVEIVPVRIPAINAGVLTWVATDLANEHMGFSFNPLPVAAAFLSIDKPKDAAPKKNKRRLPRKRR